MYAVLDYMYKYILQVAFHRRSTLNKQPPAQCLVEINEYGIRMTDATEVYLKRVLLSDSPSYDQIK